jgi:2',3'-cyclic-nucleotide 2'-phosphodiesterase / 3'-nucleotidase / 5'-nucleotidase
MKTFIITLILSVVFLSVCAFAEEITIIYTGETHAMLYPCNCPKEPDGGVARRAALIKQLREKYPASLVLDSGNFFSGGLLDEYTQNTSLDKKRAIINLKAMEIMGYDAVAVGDAEFNFGKEFLLENIDKAQVPFLSCNINFSKFLPALVKEVAGVKVGIIGLTSPLVAQKADGLKFIDSEIALSAQVNSAFEQFGREGNPGFN